MSFVACSSDYYPRLGSLCRVRVKLKANTDETKSSVHEDNEKPSVQPDQPFIEAEESAFPRCQDSVLQVPLGDWTTLRLGVGECDVTEACLERMRAGEKCEVRVKTKLREHRAAYVNFQQDCSLHSLQITSTNNQNHSLSSMFCIYTEYALSGVSWYIY